jgi:hypothetical protein
MTQPPEDGDRRQPDPTQSFPPPAGGPGQPGPGQPWYGPPGQDQPGPGPGGPAYGQPVAGGPAYGEPAYPGAGLQPTAAPPKSSIRRGMIITGVVLLVMLLIAGATLVAWLLLRDTDRDGASSPRAAVNSFLGAVYWELDASAASAQVCSEARDEAALETKIDGIREFRDAHVNPSFNWSDPEVIDESGQLAIVSVTVTMITGDEKTAEQTLHISVLDKDQHGWWVCNVDSVTGDPDADEGDEPDAEDEDADEAAGDDDGE